MFYIFIAIVLIVGISKGVRQFKGEQYLADKYDENKRNK